MYGRNKDPDLVRRLEYMKNNILSKSLTQQQKDDFMEKYNLLLKMAEGGLRTGQMDFGAKKKQ